MIQIDCALCSQVGAIVFESKQNSRHFVGALPDGWSFGDGDPSRVCCRSCSAKSKTLALLQGLPTETALEVLQTVLASYASRTEPAPTWDDDEGTKVGLGPVLERRGRNPDGHTPPSPSDTSEASS